jgi:hypothetical protein
MNKNYTGTTLSSTVLISFTLKYHALIHHHKPRDVQLGVRKDPDSGSGIAAENSSCVIPTCLFKDF